MDHPARGFYILQFWTTVAWWLLVRRISGKHIFDVAQGSVFTCPSWIPSSALQRLHGKRKLIFIAAVLALGVGALLGDNPHIGSPVRIGIALIFSLYHLLENSMTNRHGEFPVLYAVWSLCLPDPDYASALCYGSVVHFILSSGISKLLIGGPQWLEWTTMHHYLRIYCASSTAPPLSSYVS